MGLLAAAMRPRAPVLHRRSVAHPHRWGYARRASPGVSVPALAPLRRRRPRVAVVRSSIPNQEATKDLAPGSPKPGGGGCCDSVLETRENGVAKSESCPKCSGAEDEARQLVPPLVCPAAKRRVKDLTESMDQGICDPDRGLPNLSELFQALKLHSLSENDVQRAFRSMDHDGDGLITIDEVELVLRQSLTSEYDTPEVVQDRARCFMQTFDLDRDGMVSMGEFTEKIRELSKDIDSRAWRLAVCVGLAGFAVGVIQPLTPLVIASVGISLSQYGMITSFYGLMKTLANVPAAVLQETLGRLPVMCGSLALLSGGFFGFGFSTSFACLLASRAAVGAGVSAWTICTTTYALDVSHPLNRARSMAPCTAAFSIGGILGPLLGGYMYTLVGLEATFIATGAVFAAMVLGLRFLLDETLPEPAQTARGRQEQQQQQQKTKTLLKKQWTGRKGNGSPTSWKAFKAVMSYPEITASMALNAANRLVMGTAKLTLLPLLLVQVLGMDACAVGTVFSAMSFFQLLLAQPAAAFADYTGHQNVLAFAGVGQGAAVIMLSLVGSAGQAMLALSVSLWAISHTFIGASNYAYVSSVAPPKMRSQAVAVLKFSGDLATIFGGLLGACLAQSAGVGTALVTIGGLQILAALLLFLLTLREDEELPHPGGGLVHA